MLFNIALYVTELTILEFDSESERPSFSSSMNLCARYIKNESSKFVVYLFNNKISFVPFCFLFNRL